MCIRDSIYAVFLCKVTAAEVVNIVKEEKDAQIATKCLYTTLNGHWKELWMRRLSVRKSVD